MNAEMDCWISAGASDVGRVRNLNEDAFLDRPNLGLWAVADGMGGHSCGDVASQLLCSELDKIPPLESLASVVDFVEESVIDVNRQLVALARQKEQGSVIGSTIVILMARGPYAVCLWAGDSRFYRLRGGSLSCLSDDHSLAKESPEDCSPEEAEASNIITRAVGADRQLYLDLDFIELIENDRFLLCSDGLSDELSDEQIANVLQTGDADVSSRALVENAVTAGGRDNVTALVVDYRPH